MFRRRVTPRKFFRARKSLKIARQFVHSYTRTTQLTDLVPAGAGSVASYSTSFSTINNAAEYAVLYKYFRINATKWTFWLDQPEVVAGTANVYRPKFTWAVNRDLTTAPSTISGLLEYRGAKTVAMGHGPITVYVKNPAMENAGTGIPIGLKKQWYPTVVAGSPNATDFNGVTFLFSDIVSTAHIRVFRKDYFQLKGLY